MYRKCQLMYKNNGEYNNTYLYCCLCYCFLLGWRLYYIYYIMRKFKRNKRRFTFFDIILWIVFIGIVCSLVFIYYFNKVLGPGLVDCAHDEMERLTVLVSTNIVLIFSSRQSAAISRSPLSNSLT